jgi:uncharacterized membrane protein YvbJ
MSIYNDEQELRKIANTHGHRDQIHAEMLIEKKKSDAVEQERINQMNKKPWGIKSEYDLPQQSYQTNKNPPAGKHLAEAGSIYMKDIRKTLNTNDSLLKKTIIVLAKTAAYILAVVLAFAFAGLLLGWAFG